MLNFHTISNNTNYYKPPVKNKPKDGCVSFSNNISTLGNFKMHPSAYLVNFGKKEFVPKPKLSLEDIKLLREKDNKAEIRLSEMPMIFQFACSNPTGKIGHEKLIKFEEQLTQDSTLAKIYNDVNVKEKEKAYFNLLSAFYRKFDSAGINNLIDFKDLKDENTKKLIVDIMSQSAFNNRNRVAEILEYIADDSFKQKIILRLFNDKEVGVRNTVFDALRSVSDSNFKFNFLKMALKEDNSSIVEAVNEHLGSINDDSKVIELYDYIKKNSKKAYLLSLNRVLCALKDETIKTQLYENELNTEKNPEKKNLLSSYLRYLNDDTTKKRLATTFLNDSNPYVKLDALKYAENIDNKQLIEKTLRELLSSDKDFVNREAHKLIYLLSDKEEQERYFNLYFQSDNIYLRSIFIENIPFLFANETLDNLKKKVCEEEKKEYPYNYFAKVFNSNLDSFFYSILNKTNNDDLKYFIIQQIAKQKNIEEINDLCQSVKAINNPELRNQLLEELLSSDNVDIQRAALIFNIESLTNTEKRDKYIKEFAKHQNERLRSDAVGNAYLLSNSAERDKLILNAIKDPSLNVRNVASYRLSELSPGALEETDVENLFNETDNNLLDQAFKYLELIKDDQKKIAIVKKHANILEGPFLESAINSIKFINDDNLKINLIKELLKDEKIKPEAIKAIPFINDENIRWGIVEDLMNEKDLSVNCSIASIATQLENDKLMNRIVNKCVHNKDNYIQHAIALNSKSLLSAPFDGYYEMFDRELEKIDPSKTLSTNDILQLLLLYRDSIKIKPQELKILVKDYNDFVNHALKNRNRFSNGGEKVLSETEMHDYIKEKSFRILNSIFLMRKGPLINSFDKKRSSFEQFLNSLDEVSRDLKVQKSFYKAVRLPNINEKKVDAFEYNKLLNLAQGYCSSQNQQALINVLKKPIEENKLDLNVIQDDYLQVLFKTFNLEKVPTPEELRWMFDQEYIYTLPAAYNNKEKINANYKKIIIDLLKCAINGDYWKYINDLNTPQGKVNKETREIFEKEGLNYDKWMNINGNPPIERQFKLDTGERFKFKIWDRNIGKDLFLSNYAEACTALNGIHPEATIDAFLSTGIQSLEILENDKPVGKAYLYWAKDTKTGQMNLISNTIELNSEYMVEPSKEATYDPQKIINNVKIRAEATEFLKDYAIHVYGKEVPILMGQSFTRVKASDLDVVENIELKFIGNTISYKEDKPENFFYLDSMKSNKWVDVLKPHKTTLYKLR